jgi:DNA-nicking Smr family endonuclease
MGRGKGKDTRGERAEGFADLIGDVKPLKERPLQRPETKLRPIAAREGPASEPARFRFPDPDEPRMGAGPGFSDRALKKLARGDPPFEERVDLHGLDRESAALYLARALESAAARGLRCVLVVHGWGQGSGGGAVLRDKLPGWLTKSPCAGWVLAFTPALARDGGQGATYVLLRRLR